MEVILLKLQLHKKNGLLEPEIDISYSRLNRQLNRVIHYIRQQEYTIEGIYENNIYQISLNDVFYFEIVDRKTFIYTNTQIYECRKNLLTIEQEFSQMNIVKISKNVLLNVAFLKCVKPYPNHRLLVELNNGENLIVSRKYISILQERIRSDNYEQIF